MAAVAEKKKIIPSGKIKRRGQLPTKRSINLANLGEKPINMLLAIPGILLILVAAVLFSKFLVIDRLAEVSAAQAEVSRLRAQLDAGYAELADYDDLALLYAHYTYSGMTSEELARVDRAEVVDLIQRLILPQLGVTSWSVSGNQLTVNMTADTLQEVNLMVQKLEADELVDFCTVSTAVSDEEKRVIERVNGNVVERVVLEEEYTIVTAKVIIYLNPETGVKAG